MDFLALSLIMATHSVSVVRRGYKASLHSPGNTQEDAGRGSEAGAKNTNTPIFSHDGAGTQNRRDGGATAKAEALRGEELHGVRTGLKSFLPKNTLKNCDLGS